MSILRLTRNKGSRYVTFQVTISQSYILHLTRLMLLKQIHWFCEDCGTEYDTADIESRLINHIHRKLMRYQMQDIRCSKTNRVSSNSLAKVSGCGVGFKQDFSSCNSHASRCAIVQCTTVAWLQALLTTVSMCHQMCLCKRPAQTTSNKVRRTLGSQLLMNCPCTTHHIRDQGV